MVRDFALTLGSALAVVGFLAASPAVADELIISGQMDEVHPDDPRWIVCYKWDQNTDFVYVSGIHRGTVKEFEGGDNGWQDFVVRKYHPTERLYGGCNLEKSEEDANWRRGVFLEEQPNFPKTFVEVSDWVPTANVKAKTASGKAKTPKAANKQNDAKAEPAKSAAQVAAEERAARAAEREAAFQKKQAEYERQLAEQQEKVRQFELAKADMARIQAEQRAAAEKALADHAAEMAAHDAEVARYEQEVAAQKLRADFDKRHGLGKGDKASTDEDANRCVTTPETQENATFKGNTAASIINGCGQPVDVRICLMTETKGWNCGMAYGVQSQAKWSWSSFHATGPVFVDARISTSSRALGSPN